MILAVAWDIDGTLIDSEPLHLFVLQRICERYNVDISDLTEDHFVGVHIGEVWKELQSRFPEGLRFAQWVGELNALYTENADQLIEIEGAHEVVRALAQAGIKQVAVSNSNRAVVNANLAALGIEHHLKFSLSLDDVIEGKPDPFPYRLACCKLGIDPGQVLAVEDSQTGAASARAAGLKLAYLSAQPTGEGGKVSLRQLAQVPALIEGLAEEAAQKITPA